MSMASEAPSLIATTGDSLREAFGKALSGLADEFSNVVVLDADIAGGTGVHHFRKSHPERLLQFGIAEQNMMAAAGGLAAVGLIPVVTTFAVFCLRAVEQARLSLAYARRNAKIVAQPSRSGCRSGWRFRPIARRHGGVPRDSGHDRHFSR